MKDTNKFMIYLFLCMHISSSQNKQIKYLLKLQQKSKFRKKTKEFLVEGVQENQLALANGYKNKGFYWVEEIFNNEFNLDDFNQVSISKEVFEKLAYRKTTGGIIGIYEQKEFSLNQIQNPKPIIVVLEEIEKPGNLGAILRSCDAIKADAVVICDERVDFYNPNVIRSSVGTLFSNRLIYSTSQDFLKWIKREKLALYATYLREDTQNLFDLNLSEGVAWVFGTESFGLSDFWIDEGVKTVKIPMSGQVDSLNVSNAVAVCLYETWRQINFSKP